MAKCPGVRGGGRGRAGRRALRRVVALFIVRKDPSLTEQAREGLCAPAPDRLQAAARRSTFANELPKTNVGKILRRELRDELAKMRSDMQAS